MPKTLIAVLLTVSLAVPAAAAAATLNFIAPAGLSGAQEVPPRATPATGTGFAILDDVALTLRVHLTWTDLLAPAAAAHIHCCPGPGVNGLVAVDFVPVGFPAATDGEFDHVFDLDAAASYGGAFLGTFGGDVDAARSAVIAGLLDRKAYFNIHTSVFGTGEIRGDIIPVASIPGGAPLALLALGSLIGLLRRRRA
jgi:hypothetical protein